MPSNQKKLLNLNIGELESIQEFDDSSDPCEVTPRVENYLRKFDYKFVSRPTIERLHSSSPITEDVRIQIYCILTQFS